MRISHIPYALLAAGLALMASAAPSQGQSAASAPALVLDAGDAVRVEIWREPDLSGEFTVDESGRAVLPLLGPRVLTGRPFEDVKADLLEDYRSQLRNPSIHIVPLRRVSVLGEVRQPGLYPVDPTISLGEVVALAGGATSNGDLERIRLVRDGRTIAARVSPGAEIQRIDIRSGDQIIVERRSWFDRNSTFLVSALLSVTGIIASLIVASAN